MNVLQNVKGSFIRGKGPATDNKCMTCGKVIQEPMPGPDGRRFCSQECRDKYFH